MASFYLGLFEAVPDAEFDLINAFIGETGIVEESVLRGTSLGPMDGCQTAWK